MAVQIAVRLPDDLLTELDHVVATGRAHSRAEAVRNAVELLVRVEREREIADEYARAYGAEPQEDWIGQAGLALGAKLLESEPEL
jgi:Arc/MetJ-type ribon-helix-helix transcriptional regulator